MIDFEVEMSDTAPSEHIWIFDNKRNQQCPKCGNPNCLTKEEVLKDYCCFGCD